MGMRWWDRPNLDRAIMRSRGKHERVGHGIPGDARQVAAAERLRSNMMEQCGRFTIPDVNVTRSRLVSILYNLTSKKKYRTFTSAQN